jgi:argininosuccinate lyase
VADESAGRLWGGRFAAGPSDAMAALSRSVHVDFRLAPYDIAQTRAHVEVLQAAGLLTADEASLLDDALAVMLVEVLAGTLQPGAGDEDVHSAVERELLERVGPVGGKVRAGRSRNDQVATDFKLYLRHHARLTAGALCDLMDALLDQARTHVDSVAPGFTHLQHAQPVSFGHELAKHVHALHRDVSRLRDWDHRHDTSPLGAGALAGSSLGLDADQVARTLGFARPMGNSIDAVSARDWVAEFCFVGAMVAVTLSRIGEEVVLWTSREFGWATLDDAWSTGSSIMPQKKNPDVAELARGKAGRLLGNLAGLLATMQSMPFAYNRDLQEDKEPAFDTVEQLAVLLPAMTGMIATLRFDVDAMADSAPQGYALATDIAEWLVRGGVPFRDAHSIAGACVRRAEARGVELWDLTDAEFRDISDHLTSGVRAVLSVRGSLESRSGSMGTAPARVREQLAALADRVAADRTWADDTSWVPRTLTGPA